MTLENAKVTRKQERMHAEECSLLKIQLAKIAILNAKKKDNTFLSEICRNSEDFPRKRIF